MLAAAVTSSARPRNLFSPLVTVLVCLSPAMMAFGQTITPIQHIVFIVKENRSYDNYFGTYALADGATSGPISTGQVIPLAHTPDQVRTIGHDWYSALEVIDGGKMDLFDINYAGNYKGDYLAYSQLTQADIPNYFT